MEVKLWRKLRRVLPAISLMAVVYYLDSILLGAPIVAAAAWLGGIRAFVFLVPVYTVFDYSLGRMTLRLVIEDKAAKDYGLVMRLVRRWFNTFRDVIPVLEKRLSSKNRLRLRIVGYVFASYYGGAFGTAPVMYILGQRRYLRSLSAASAFIYAVTFVGQCALGTSIVLVVAKHIVHWL